MSDINALHDKRAALLAQASEIYATAAEAGAPVSTEDEARFTALETEAKTIDAAIRAGKAADEARTAADAARTAVAPALAQAVSAPVDADEAAELRRIGRHGGELSYEMRDISKGSNFTGRTDFATTVAVAAGQVNPFLNPDVVTVFRKTDGSPIGFPRTTALGTASAISEGGQYTESDGTNSTLTLTPAKYGVLVQVSEEVISDTGIDISAWIAEAAGQSVGIAHGAVAAPAVAAAATVGKQGAAVTPAYADLIDLVYSVAEQHRRAPKRGFLLNDATLASVLKIVDDNAQPIFKAGVNGQPDTIFGYPVYSAALANNGDEALSVLFGDLGKIVTVVAGGVDIRSSADFALNYGLVTYRVGVRGATGLLLPSAVKSFKGANV
jgi:HK97 family phage major capsid protein